MEKTSTTKRMGTIMVIFLIIALIGGIFQIQHYPFGQFLFLGGQSAYILISLIELDRLRKLVQNK